MTFEFRSWPNAERSGSIDPSHKGPCAVYIKPVDDMFSDAAAGPGWFKIWEDGFNADTGKWCVETMIENDGLLSVNIPTGLPSGYYLVRPELLALHAAPDGDPQFYHSCAQIFIENGSAGTLNIPSEYEVSIPGHVSATDPGLNFNLYYGDDTADYVLPGPAPYVPTSSGATSTVKRTQDAGAIPADCILKNGNWCAKPVPTYDDQTSCWGGAENCWDQSATCWDTMPVSGGWNCEVWADYCKAIGESCEAGQYTGPPEFTGEEIFSSTHDSLPEPYNVPEGTEVETPSGPIDEDEEEATTTSAPAPSVAPTTLSSAPAPASTTSATTAPSTVPKPAPPTNDEEEEEGNSGNDEPELTISLDGRCGGSTGQTCVGSSFGDCCSKKGKCGRKTRHCTCGCQSAFGKCRE